MRITNNIITSNTKYNINNNKVSVNTLNNQMSSQKKIDRPSDDPVVAIRALRLRSSLSEIDQYYEKNIPDAESWLDVTETALTNMKKVLTDIHTQCVYGATDSLTADDRNTILSQLQALADQVYSEGNADYAGRSVFTGYKTNATLTFSESEPNTSYNITQSIPSSAMNEHTYYYDQVTTPTNQAVATAVTSGTSPTSPGSATMQRERLSYDKISTLNNLNYSYSTTDASGNKIATTVDLKAGSKTVVTTDPSGVATTVTSASTFNCVTMTTSQLETAKYNVPGAADKVIFNPDTGELLIGKNVATDINTNSANMTANYDKTGFKASELRPENYYDCKNTTDAAHPITYTNYDANGKFISEDINYTVATNQTLNVNTVANDVFDSSIGRDVNELLASVKTSIAAHDTVDNIKAMMKETQFSDTASQAKLQEWLDVANKQVDYSDNDMKKMYSNGITGFSNYMSKVNLANTDVGSKGDRLDIIKTRMGSQQTTVKSLKSSNEDRDLSDIVIDYTSAYTAYQASLQAAGKLSKQTLLDYL
jgi:flagellar hook-associated protein 3 FlgL